MTHANDTTNYANYGTFSVRHVGRGWAVFHEGEIVATAATFEQAVKIGNEKYPEASHKCRFCRGDETAYACECV